MKTIEGVVAAPQARVAIAIARFNNSLTTACWKAQLMP